MEVQAIYRRLESEIVSRSRERDESRRRCSRVIVSRSDMCIDMSYYYQYYSWVICLSREETQHVRTQLRSYLHNGSISAVASDSDDRNRENYVAQYCTSSSKYSI